MNSKRPKINKGIRLPIAPSMEPLLLMSHIRKMGKFHIRIFIISFYAMVLGLIATAISQGLTHLIGFCTNLFFFRRLSIQFVDPSNAPNWGVWVIFIPVFGGLIVGLMAKYGSEAIRGHGIPEAMEKILTNESRIPWRLIFLKPLSAAIAIGSGGPFGAEGPIIATGGALGSCLGQIIRVTSTERKTLLAAGAAAGMTATFGSPISAILLAVELLLFEFRPRTMIPVALAAATANAARITILGVSPVFLMPTLEITSGQTVLFYALMGGFIGVAAVIVTRLVYAIEDGFERLPFHWMWWPAFGGIAVGLIGYYYPKTLGVGYSNIDAILGGEFAPQAIGIFCFMKLASWAISLGSGTSGGTLAPLFMIGGGIGTLLGTIGQKILPWLQIDLKAAALVGMAALFAGASRALLASVVFAFEATGQQLGLLPLLVGCTVSYLISSLLMKTTIMSEKIERRGVRVPHEYTPDFLDTVLAKDFCTHEVISIMENETVDEILIKTNKRPREFSHQAYPVLSYNGAMVGVVSLRDILNAKDEKNRIVKDLIKKPSVYIFDNQTLREAADLMALQNIGRVIVVSRHNTNLEPVGIITRSDLLKAHQIRLKYRNQT